MEWLHATPMRESMEPNTKFRSDDDERFEDVQL